MLGMSVKNFDKKPLTIEWEIIEKNATTGQTISSGETYTRYYGDVTPYPSPACPWGDSWTSISVEPYPIPDYVTGNATYTMVCNYVVQQYTITWEIIEKNSGTGETRHGAQYYACYNGDVTPVPSFPPVNPWDGNPWTSTSIDPYPQYVTGPATYDAVFTYDPVVIPTGFSMDNIRSGYPLDNNAYTNWCQDMIVNPEGCSGYSGSGVRPTNFYLYNNEYVIGCRQYNDSSWNTVLDLILIKYTDSTHFSTIDIGCLGIRDYIGDEYNFWYNGDKTFINQKYGGDLDAYVAHLFNDGILSLATPPPAP